MTTANDNPQLYGATASSSGPEQYNVGRFWCAARASYIIITSTTRGCSRRVARFRLLFAVYGLCARVYNMKHNNIDEDDETGRRKQ